MFVIALAICFRDRLLPVVGAGAVLAKKVFIEQHALHRFGRSNEPQGFACQLNDVLEHEGVVNSVRNGLPPRKGAVAGDEDCRTGEGIAS